jgi:tRNA 2-selenouridine synthase SelU
MPLPKDLLATEQLLSREFPEAQLVNNDYEALLELLALHIEYLCQHHFEGLLQAMYRMDVREEDFQQALGDSRALAELVLQRALQKIESRKKYSSE